MRNYLLNIQSFLICLIPISLISGPALSDIIISIAGILFLYSSIRYKIFKYYFNHIIQILFIFCIYIIIRSIFSEFIFLSLESSLFYSRFVFFSLSVWYVLENVNSFKKYFFWSIVFSLCLLIIDSYFQYFIGKNIIGYSYDGERLSSFFNEEKILGSYLSRIAPLFLALVIYLFSDSKKMVIFSLVIIILIDILVILSGERSSIFYLFFSTFLIILMINKWKYLRIIAFGISIFIGIIIISSNQNVKDRVLNKTLEQTNIFEDKINIFSIQHQVIYESALKIFYDYPIFGVGPKVFREKCKEKKYQVYTDEDHSVNGCQTHPHNTYIQALSEIGVVGFSFIFSFFVYILFVFIRHTKNIIFYRFFLLTDFQVCLYTSIFISLWPFVPTGNFFNNWLSIIYFLPLGFLLFSFRMKEK